MSFKDHFSGHASVYASFRPGYPPALFDFAASLPNRHGLAWDCATGNGQATAGLAERFERVIATDASAEQLSHAAPHPRVEYRQALAEASGLGDGEVDLITVATALHWFDFDRFYAEVNRVLAPGGALVAWAYNLARVSPELDVLIDRLGREIVGPYWPPERRWVDEEYRTLPFPFDEVEVPALWIEEQWDFSRFVPYFSTWSATNRYRKATGHDPLEEVGEEMERAWGDPSQVRTVRWPIMMRAGRPRR
ncbi:MAG TPA: class I SAM-dependent methyltransferase [Thermoanaerobaculia bacterium]|nr:class I SAM-dependent methyltransferase [Thermoanaerobaculia bacterium]